MNQRMVSRHAGGISLWAWSLSITVHMLVVGVFAVVRFSRTDYSRTAIPTVALSKVDNLLASTVAMPKPKVKKARRQTPTAETEPLARKTRLFAADKAGPENPPDLVESPSSSASLLFPGPSVPLGETDFFGALTRKRRICYVVDCSGSMKGAFGDIRRRLKESISKLAPDQYFDIIFFGNNRLYEFSPNGLVRATAGKKSEACRFIDRIEPAGRTNAEAAFQKSLQVRDSRGNKASVVYFLTDGFELGQTDTNSFSRRIEEILRRSAPATQVNTIAFWPRRADRAMLQTIAERSGGQCVVIEQSGN